ncbi:DUF3826 domain-containing protein [Flavobacteriaceae bacterium GSB9]|nr:DUF3826 domain-containing protein [Flavobacteriaceae bacterium GSB9]
MFSKKITIGLMFVILVVTTTNAQQHLDPEYIKVTEQRAGAIVEGMGLSGSEKAHAVTQIIAKQYQNLSKFHDAIDAKVDAIKAEGFEDAKEERKIAKAKQISAKKINKLHKSYLKQLDKHLNETQMDAVKDGMTYGVLPKTYTAFLEMIPSLTEPQKQYIYDNLKEAREHAMDAGSSKEKHAWFGKYKGRINNFLSAEGYDLERERDGWYKRIEEQKKQSKK